MIWIFRMVSLHAFLVFPLIYQSPISNNACVKALCYTLVYTNNIEVMKTTLLFILTIFSLARLNSQPATLDSSFGTNGHFSLGFNFTATAFQPDGKVVGVRSQDSAIVVNRYNTD